MEWHKIKTESAIYRYSGDWSIIDRKVSDFIELRKYGKEIGLFNSVKEAKRFIYNSYDS